MLNDSYFFRDLYYQDTQQFGSQTMVDDIVDNISCMLRIPRWDLHVVSASNTYYDLSPAVYQNNAVNEYVD